MSYNSVSFFVFLLFFFCIYFLVPKGKTKAKQAVILAGNLVFYRFAGLNRLAVLIGTSLIVYGTSRILEHIYAGYETEKEGLKPKEQAALLARYKKRCRKWLYLALFVVVGILVYIKVGKTFGWREVGKLKDFRLGSILVPLGISYYTFSSVGYLLDIYWRKAKCEHSYLKFLTCMTFFPHIVEGPIGHYDKIMGQFGSLPGYEDRRVCFGLQLLLWGTFKKIVVADRLALFTGTIFTAPGEFAGIEVFLAVTLGAIQLYADFSGCMDMVGGIAQVMGVSLEKNFNHPFFSRSAAEFWRRWHMTLGAWYKDYILMPIATSPRFMRLTVKVRERCGKRAGRIFSTAVPTAVVWILTGMWHGTGMSYLAWGLYWGTLIILSDALSPEIKKASDFLHIQTESRVFAVVQMVRTFFLFCIGRMFTAAGSLGGCVILWSRLFYEPRLGEILSGGLFKHGLDAPNFCVALLGILLMWSVSIFQERMGIRERIASAPLVVRWPVYYGAILLILVFGMYGSVYDASTFVYGEF